MAKRIVVVLLVVTIVLLLVPSVGMAMATAPCPECTVPAPASMGVMCLAVLGAAIALASTSVGRSFAPMAAERPTGPPGSRPFRPPRSS